MKSIYAFTKTLNHFFSIDTLCKHQQQHLSSIAHILCDQIICKEAYVNRPWHLQHPHS